MTAPTTEELPVEEGLGLPVRIVRAALAALGVIVVVAVAATTVWGLTPQRITLSGHVDSGIITLRHADIHGADLGLAALSGVAGENDVALIVEWTPMKDYWEMDVAGDGGWCQIGNGPRADVCSTYQSEQKAIDR